MKKGKLNKLVDKIFHPHFKKHPELIIVDEILHIIIEQNPKQSFKKFIKYNLNKILKHI